MASALIPHTKPSLLHTSACRPFYNVSLCNRQRYFVEALPPWLIFWC